ncbi:hypothetical protein NQ317_014321 [Molorchus minor]|uniref:Uncharacterized protein n=1 Tax=Molorchus minor TaxID=1323400 RepID=A0ABQ9JYN0_9CUCU|nr:hypothetical protein NQ317_014321 [Molorchus minor]
MSNGPPQMSQSGGPPGQAFTTTTQASGVNVADSVIFPNTLHLKQVKLPRNISHPTSHPTIATKFPYHSN